MGHLDAALFALETPTNHMHVGLVGKFGPPPPGVDVVALMRERLERKGSGDDLRLKVVTSALGLWPSLLRDSGPIDVRYHVSSVDLGPGADDARLDEWVGEELSHPLNRSKPLWRVFVLTGFPDGGFALFIKGHHGVVDGITALRMALNLLDGERTYIGRRPRKGLLAGRGGRMSSTLGGVLDLLQWPGRVLHVILGGSKRVVVSADVQPTPRMFGAPRTPINRSISAQRAVARVELPLSDVIDVRRTAGCTGNDVVLALVSSAVRSVLKDRGVLPRRPLTAIVPAAQTGDEWRKRSGNRLHFWFVSLATNIDDPARRLAAVARSTKAAQDRARMRGADLWERYAGAVLPGGFHWVIRLAERLKLSDHIPPLGSIIVSNMTGPRHEMTLGGAPMLGVWPFGPPKDGGAINVTVVSYKDCMHVGIQGDRRLTEEIHQLAAALPAALRELQETQARTA